MAHSARSKSKLKSKAAKVNNSNSDYFKLSEARKERLAKKLKDNLELQKNKKAENKDEDDNLDENAMAVDDEKPSSSAENKLDFNKISTSGWRTSRKAVYKKKKASKNKNKTMKF